MKLERLCTASFGGLEAFDSGEEPLGDLIVVSGRNESGKTTFFHMLGSLLYGIYPTSPDQHPYAPWSGHELQMEADLRVQGDQLWSITRRLKASPAGLLKRGEGELTLRNDTLPCVTHVTRNVFHQIFALTHSEVATLESEAWSQLQDRLIGAMGARDLVTARSAAEALEGEAGSLWRPDRRGKQEVRGLRERIHEARARRRQASDTDRILRRAMGDLERARHDLKEAKLGREQQRLVIERTTTLLPAKKQLDHAAALEREAGPLEDLEGIPADPAAAHHRLVADVTKLQQRLARICENTKVPTKRIAEFGPAHARVLEGRTAIEDLGTEVAGSRTAHTRLGSLTREVQDRRRQISASVNEIFTRALTEEEQGVVRRIIPRQLRERARAAAQVRDRQRERDIRSSLRPAPPAPSLRTLVLGGAAGLAAASIWTVGVEGSWLKGLAGLLAVVSVTLITRWWTMREAYARNGPGVSDNPEITGGAAPGGGPEQGDATRTSPTTAAATDMETARGKLLEVLGDLPVREDVLEEAGPELAATITRLQELMQDLEARTAEADDLNSSLKEASARIASVGAGLEIELPGEDSAAVHVLQSKLRDAQRAEESSISAARELDVLEATQQELRQELDERTRDLDLLEDAARRLGGEDVEAGLQTATRRQSARRRAEQIREDVSRLHPDLEELSARLDQLESAKGGAMGDDELAAARLALDEQSNHIEELTGRVKELEHECARAGEQATVDQIDGEIEAFESDLDDLESEHDRKLLLAHIIREADRRFRDEHQPDVVRKASEYLKTITGARYDRINVGEGGSFYVRGAGADTPVEASLLSTGAREQLYLSIRLAVMNHLDEGRERLPLCVDEAFVNWDASRRAKGFELLRQLSEIRQVFVMTCHEPWADELVELGAQRIDLK